MLGLRFFQNFREKPRKFSVLFTKVCPQPPYLFFFLEHTTDRQIGFLSWVLKPPVPYWSRASWTCQSENLLQITSTKYVFFLFFTNLLANSLKVFIFMKQKILALFLIFEESWLSCIRSFSRQNLLCADYSPVHKYKYWWIQTAFIEVLKLLRTYKKCSFLK